MSSAILQVRSRPSQSEGLDPAAAETTWQFRWITTIHGGLEALFQNHPDVFVAGQLRWYPVENEPLVRIAPNVMVVLGRPKGDRGAYRQWLEENIAPQVVFEVLSRSDRPAEILRKRDFCQQHGVEEYYVYDPEDGDLLGWRRLENRLAPIPNMSDWVSPRLGVRFGLVDGELRLSGLDGRPFATYVELVEQRRQAEQEQVLTEELRRIAEEQRCRLEEERRKAVDRIERLAAQIRTMGMEPTA
jgi:Uma2 family endonuclease